MAGKVKRNIKALKRLRAIFAKVPPRKIDMSEVSPLNGRGCLLYHGRNDKTLTRLRHDHGFEFGWGLTYLERSRLFAFAGSVKGDPSKVTKTQALASLDAAIAGKPIKPYVVKPTP